MPQQKQQQQGMPSAQPAASVPGSMPSIDLNAPKADSAAKSSQQKSGGPVLEDSFLDPLGHGDRTSVNAKSKDAAAVKQAIATLLLYFQSSFSHYEACDFCNPIKSVSVVRLLNYKLRLIVIS